MGIKNFFEDLKAKSIDPLLKDQAVKYTEAALTRYQNEIGRELTPDELQFAANKLTPDRINSGAYAKKAIAEAIRSIPIAGKTIAGGVKAAAEIPALMLEVPEALKSLSSFGGRKGVKQALGGADIAGGLAQAGKFTRDLATDVTGIQDGQGFQDLPTGIGTVAGALVGGAGYLKAIGAATEGAVAANIFKDLTAKGLTNTVAQAGTKRFIAGTAANTVTGSPLSLAASMDDEGNINPKDLALNLTIDTAFGGAIEGAGALLTKNYGKQALKGIAETNRAFNRRNVEAYKAKGLNEARAAEEAKLAAAQKYEKIESDLMQARSLTEQRQGQLADEQVRLGLKDETRQNVSVLNDIYEAEKQTAFKQIDTEQDKLVSEIQRESEQKTKDLVKQKADIDKQERTLTKPFDLEEKNLAKQQKQVNDSYQRAKKQAETEPVQILEETPPIVTETPLVNSKNYEEEFNLFKEKTKNENEKIKVQIEQNKIKKINNLDNKIKQQQESYAQELESIQKDYSNSIEELNKLPDSISKQKKIDQAQKRFDRATVALNKKIQGIEGVRSEKIKQIEEQAASKFNTISANAEKALESERLRLTAQQEPLAKPTGLDQKANAEFNKFQKDLSSQAKAKIENIKVFKTKKTDALKLELQKLEEASAEADVAYNKIKRDFLQEGALEKFDETEKKIVATKKKLDTLKKLYSEKLKEINEITNRQIELVKTKAEEQLKIQEDKVNALKQKRQNKHSKSGKSLTQEELNEIPNIKRANIALGKYKYQIKEVTQKKIARIKSFAKEKVEKLKLDLTEEKANFESFLQQKESLKSILDNPSLKKAEEQRNRTQEQLNKFKNKTYPERLKKLQETVAKQIDTVKTKQQQALEAKQAEIGQLKADLETKRLQDIELQKQQIKEQRLKALDDEYNAARSDVDTRLSVTNANRNQAVSEFQAKKQALLEQQQKLEQELKDKVDYLNRRREVLKKQKEVALNRQFKKDALREYRAKMGIETPVLRNADDIEVDRMIAKEELDQIDSQLAELRNKANPPEPSELKTGTVAQTGEEFYKDMVRAMYPNNKKLAAKVINHGAFVNDVDIPTATTKPENIVLKKAKETGNFANDVLQPMISGLRDVSARLAGKVRQFEFMAAKKTNKYLEPAATFFTKLNRFLTKEEKELFNSYIVKGDQESILAFLSKIDAQGKQYQELPALIKAPVKFLDAEDTNRDFLKHINKPLTEQWQTIRETLDDLHGQLEDAGVEVGYIQDYFPTSVKKDSVDTWREIFGIGTEERSAFDAALKQEKKKLGRDLDLDEENEFINKYLRGYGNTNSIPILANLKARSGLAQGMEGLTFRDAKGKERLISTLYNDPSTTLKNYINRAIFDIESRKFFGRTEEGLDTSIGAYVNDLMVTGQIKGSDVDKVKELLTARFVQGPKKPADFTRLGKDLAIGFALNDIGSALVQANEVGMSFYRNGLLNTIKGLGQSFNPKALKTLDLGIQRIGADYANAPSVMRAAVDLGLKLNGFKAANKLMQETQINAAFNYFKNVFAKEKGAKFNKEYSYLKGAFGVEEADRMVDAFRSKSLQEAYDDDSIGLALFDRLGATQVISLSDMPKVYLKHPNSRMFYALKSFALKQLQFIKDESYNKISGSIKSMATEGANAKNIKLGGEGLRNLMALGLIVGGTNTGVNYLRDALRGKTSEDYQSIEERAVEGLMQATIPVINPFIFYKIEKEGIGNALKNWVSPATPLLDNISKDILEFGKAMDKGEDYNPWLSRTLFSMIPVAGATLWSWSPAGREQYEKVIKAKVKNRATKEKNEKEKEFAKLRGY